MALIRRGFPSLHVWPRVIVAVHFYLIPLAIAATRYTYGFEDALTPHNQRTWTPIVAAQSILLSMYLAFGSGSLVRRVLYFLIGSVALTCTVVWAYSVLSTFPDPKWKLFVLQFRMNSLWILTPTWLSAIALLFLRPIIGGIDRQNGADRTRQISLQDAFIVTTLSAIGAAWFSYVARIPLQGLGNAKHLSDVIPLMPLLSSAVERGLGILAVIGLVFSRQYLIRWLGVFAFFGWLAWLSFFGPYRSLDAWFCFYIGFTWSIVLAAACAYRLLGYYLMRRDTSVVRLETQLSDR